MKFKRDWSKIEEHELELDSRPASYEHNRLVFEGLYQQAIKLNLLPSPNPLEDIEVDIKVAKILNAIRKIN